MFKNITLTLASTIIVEAWTVYKLAFQTEISLPDASLSKQSMKLAVKSLICSNTITLLLCTRVSNAEK